MSPGQEGAAAVSEDSMSQWMEYLHMQQPKPANGSGVTVVLTAVDPNNNLVTIGEATSDLNGVYGFTWTPEVPGLYQIIASFAGSESYGSSTATTYLTAIQTPTATPEPTQAPVQSMADQYLLPGIIGIIIAIVAVGIGLALLIARKRP